jgi:predicted DNA-binding WGR domain protein
MTNTNTNTKKIVLVNDSEGVRGAIGKKKVYEILVEGNKVTLSWGMAEKSNRQTKVEWFGNANHAEAFATEKQWSKVDRGYQIAFVA